MQTTGNYGLKKPEGNDVVNIDDLNYNADIIDVQLKVNADNLTNHSTSKQTHGISDSYYIAKTTRSDQFPSWADIPDKPSSFNPSTHTHTKSQITDFLHKSTHANGGNDALTPADIGAETPSGAQAKVNTHANNIAAHSATSAATANRIIMRDSYGRAKVAAPAAADDITNLSTVQALLGDIKNTTQYPTFTNGQITKIEHKDAQNNILRTDTFSYTPTLITETRTLSIGITLTIKHYFDTNGDYIRTEVT